MKKMVKKLGLHKDETERTKTQKIVRDVAFFGVVVYAAVMTFMVFSAEADRAEAETNLVSANVTASQVALAK
jgi:hypothetical protein